MFKYREYMKDSNDKVTFKAYYGKSSEFTLIIRVDLTIFERFDKKCFCYFVIRIQLINKGYYINLTLYF